jgi:hypothetical protein
MALSRRSIRTTVAAAALAVAAGTALAAAPAASADTPSSYCGSTAFVGNHFYSYDHAYTSGGHTYFQYSTLLQNGDNWDWNGIFSYRCDGNLTPGGAGSAVGQILSVYDHSYVSGGTTYYQYSQLRWDGSNWQWDGFIS